MRKGILLLLSMLLLVCAGAQTSNEQEVKFISIDSLMIIGKGFEQTTAKYGRVPEALRTELRPELLQLGANSSGLAVRFNTNSSFVAVKWTVLNDVNMNHMPGTGIKGLDLYVLDGGSWHYVGTAKPNSKSRAKSIANTSTNPAINSGNNAVANESVNPKESYAVFVKNMTVQNREFIAYLPLYDGVTSVEIGVEQEAQVRLPQNNRLIKSELKKPILFYGTSITQGGCASRPGMAYTNILGRMLNRETLNLGFSGNGRLDFSMAKAINMADVESVVLDCLPNTTAQSVRDSAYNFISHIAKERPSMKIYMVENPNFPYLIVNQEAKAQIEEENSEWRELYARLVGEGFSNIIYIRGDNLLGQDGESTVDGVHFTDLGFLRYAQALMEYLNQ